MILNYYSLCLIILVTVTRGSSKSVRPARDLKVVSKSGQTQTQKIYIENVHELTISGDPSELQALINAIKSSNTGAGNEQLNYVGCYKEIGGRLMKGASEVFKTSLTPEKCQSYCNNKGMRYFGLQYGQECFCSLEKPPSAQIGDFQECSMKCTGNSRQTCGGVNRLSVYDSRQPETDQRNYLGCFKEIEGRLMKGALEVFTGSLTLERCTSVCKGKGMRFVGLQYSQECFCSMERPSFDGLADINECNLKCTGDPRETCGGYNRLSVYDTKPDQLNYLGCFKEKDGRLMKGAGTLVFARTLTPQLCMSECTKRGFRFFGLQYSEECFCSSERPPSDLTANSDECNMGCTGNPGEICGGVSRLSIYDSKN